MVTMRSAPASNRSAPGEGNAEGLDGKDPDGKQHPLLAAAGLESMVYTHERMLELFRPQSVTEDFVASDCVFSEKPLTPVSLTELTAKERELLSGPVNSISSRRYNGGQHQSSHAHIRSGIQQKANGYGSRNRPRDGPTYDRTNGDHGMPALGAEDPNGDKDGENLWADQSIVRDSVGSFGADGVFRMSSGGGDDGEGDLLERPSPRSSGPSGALRGPSAYSSRTTSPAVVGQRSGAGGSLAYGPGSSRSPPMGWPGAGSDDLSGAAQQRQLVERAEQVNWWYRDPQGNTQGPFSTANMQDWLSGGYFPSDLQVCHEGGGSFVPLGAIVSRAGRTQDAFLHYALALVAQSAVGTPATPNTLSRVGSAAHLPAPANDAFSSSIAAPPAAAQAATPTNANLDPAAPVASTDGGGYSEGGAPWNSPPSGTEPSGSAEASGSSQAAQLSALLREQLLLVTAVGERQHSIAKLQEQLQQALAGLVQELAQEGNVLRQTGAQPDRLFALQQHAQAAEERLRHEHAQLIQMHVAHMAQLEAKTDPVIKDILLRNGAAYTLNFIGQQLQELGAQIANESAQSPPQNRMPTDERPAEDTPSPTAAGGIPSQPALPPAPPTEPVQASPEPAPTFAAAAAAAVDVDATQAKLEELAVAEKKPAQKPPAPKKQKQAAGKKGTPAASSAKPAAKKNAATDEAAGTKPNDTAKSPAPAASPAPWSAGSSAKNKQPKKSLLQIQQEEEEATRKRQQAEADKRAQSVSSSFPGTSYADRLGSNGNGAAPQSLAAIMEEQYKQTEAAAGQSAPPPASNATAWSPSPTVAGSLSAKSSAPTSIAKTQSARSAAKAKADTGLPSMDFLQWCHTRLGSLRGIDACKFIEMLLTFPLQAPEMTLEIISEQIYAYSTTLNGRAFAEDFAKRRHRDHNAVKNGSLQSAPPNWPQLLNAPKVASST
ncbi:kinesin-like protein, partial [Coemansia sp. RSA 552]